MQGTVSSFDPQTRTGSLVTDLGAVVDFPAPAFDRSGLLLLRPGQRVAFLQNPAGLVELVTLVGFPTP